MVPAAGVATPNSHRAPSARRQGTGCGQIARHRRRTVVSWHPNPPATRLLCSPPRPSSLCPLISPQNTLTHTHTKHTLTSNRAVHATAYSVMGCTLDSGPATAHDAGGPAVTGPHPGAVRSTGGAYGPGACGLSVGRSDGTQASDGVSSTGSSARETTSRRASPTTGAFPAPGTNPAPGRVSTAVPAAAGPRTKPGSEPCRRPDSAEAMESGWGAVLASGTDGGGPSTSASASSRSDVPGPEGSARAGGAAPAPTAPAPMSAPGICMQGPSSAGVADPAACQLPLSSAGVSNAPNSSSSEGQAAS